MVQYQYKESKKPSFSRIIIRGLALLILYGLVSGVLIFSFPKEVSEDYQKKSSVSNFYSNDLGCDRVVLINDPFEAGVARINIIEKAQKTLDVSYYAIDSGEYANVFLGMLLDAADRGVKVNLVLDGIFHGMKKDLKDVVYTFMAHPNIELKFYEPLNVFKPWTLNNRLHDKYIIADNRIVIIGGRNIGDKYFGLDSYRGAISHDRDVVIMNTDEKDQSSVINQMSDYFQLVWNCEYVKSPINQLSARQYKAGSEKKKDLEETVRLTKKNIPALFHHDIDWLSLSFPANKITLIHNPVERFSKEPWCWYEITQLMKSAQQSIFIQSPYIIPNPQMIQAFSENNLPLDVDLLTNSLGSTPNFPAYAGYIKYRKKIIDTGVNVYEYQGKDSIHGKSFAIDDDLVLIGSFNFDPRSVYLSTETMVVIHSKGFAHKFKEEINEYINQSLLVASDYTYAQNTKVKEEEVRRSKKIIITTLSYFIGLFDYML